MSTVSNLKSLPLIKIQDLRLGMMVHLGMSWLSHPFPRSSFRITSEKQVETIRELGLQEVHWEPEASLAVLDNKELAEPPAISQPLAPDAATALAAQPLKNPNEHSPGWDGKPSAQQRRSQIQAEKAVLTQCEQLFNAATTQYNDVLAQIDRNPVEAKKNIEDLADKLTLPVSAKDIGIRVLGGRDNDRLASHAVNVATLAMLMGHSFGWTSTELRDLGMGALLHDIGKTQLPTRLHRRSASFTNSEARLYEEHVQYGLDIGRRMGLGEGTLSIIEQHHELGDRSGFPNGIGTNKMSAAARIVALINRYDNLCNATQANEMVTPHEAISRLFALNRGKFDVTILAAFIKMMGVYPAGSTVQLSDQRFALVTIVNSSMLSPRPLKPTVMVYEPHIPREEALILDLENEQNLGILRAIKPHELPIEVQHYLQPKPRLRFSIRAVVDELVAA